MRRFYEVVYRFYEAQFVWSDGDVRFGTIYACNLEEAIKDAHTTIKGTVDFAKTLTEEDTSYLVAINFWNDDKNDVFCTVTLDEVCVNEDISEYWYLPNEDEDEEEEDW